MRYLALAGLVLALGGCAGGSQNAQSACESAGHKPGTSGYEACKSKVEADQAAATRRIANTIPLDGYGPRMGRF